MNYNPFFDLQRNNFSWRRDYEMTHRHLNSILIDKPSKLLGTLSCKRDVDAIRELYLLGGTLAFLGAFSFLSDDFSGTKAALFGSLASLLVAPVHHYAMGKRE
jgi:hypothetical protein